MDHFLLAHPLFPALAATFHSLEQYQGPLSTLDPSFVELLLLEMADNQDHDRSRKQRLKSAIEKMEKIVNFVEEKNQIVTSKLNWIGEQMSQMEESKVDIQEQIQILSGQAGHTQPIGMKGGNSDSGESALQQLLAEFECQKGFPKNKTEALMLINRLQVQIQQLQMLKLSQYT